MRRASRPGKWQMALDPWWNYVPVEGARLLQLLWTGRGLPSSSVVETHTWRRKQMADTNEDLVRQGYKAFGEGDMDTLRALFAPDAVHVATGNTPIAGKYEGIDAILGYYGKLFELSDGTFSATLESMVVEGDDTVIATHRDKGQRGDKTLDQDETLTFTISGGKFTRLVESRSDHATYDAFWS